MKIMRIIIYIIGYISFIFNCYGQDIAVEDDSSLSVLRNSLVELQWSVNEIESISEFFSGDAFLNTDATEEVFKEKGTNRKF